MENLPLTWDLFVIVFFLIILAYSVMIGKDQTMKVILASYIAIMASDALGNLIGKTIGAGSAVASIVNIPTEDKTVILIKISIFVLLTVLLVTRGAFDITMADERSHMLRILMTVAYGILSAGLIISTVLVYVSGASLIEAGTIFVQDPVDDIAQGSRLVTLMIDNYSIWFSLPAIAFVISSLFGEEE